MRRQLLLALLLVLSMAVAPVGAAVAGSAAHAGNRDTGADADREQLHGAERLGSADYRLTSPDIASEVRRAVPRCLGSGVRCSL